MKQNSLPSGLKEFPAININLGIKISVPNNVFASMDTETMNEYAHDAKKWYFLILVNALHDLPFARIECCEAGCLNNQIMNEVYAYIDDHYIQRIDVAAVLTVSGDYKDSSDTQKRPLFSARSYDFQYNGNHFKSWVNIVHAIEDRIRQVKQLFPPKMHGYEVVIAELNKYSAPPCEMEVINSCCSEYISSYEFNTYEGALFCLRGLYTYDPYSSDGASGYVIPFIRKKDHSQTVLAYLNYNEGVVELPHTAYMI